jgi:beta-lactamase regulating signal transducer with metallopeptidase domain
VLIHALENFILFNTSFALGGFLVACLLMSAVTHRRLQVQPYTLSRVYTGLLVIPPVLSAWLVGASLLPEVFMTKSAFEAAHPSPLHELHLLGEMTAALEPTLAYLTLLFLIGAASFAAASTARGYLRVSGLVKRLEVNAAQPTAEQLSLVQKTAARYGMEVGLVMSNYPFSFVWGFTRSKLILSTGLLCDLTREELAGVIEHEATHHLRRDNLVKLLLNICCCSSLAFPLSRLILKWRAVNVEMICDEVAAARTAAPLEIAEALIKLRRLTLPPKPNRLPIRMSGSAFVPDGSQSLERRVHRLIDFADRLPAPEQVALMSIPRKGRALIFAAAFTTTLVALTMLAPLAVHHAAEAVIHFLE